MSFRVSALVAGLAVLGAAELAPLMAQPQAPVRPRYSSFGNIFSPNRGPNGAAVGGAQMQPFVNPIGPQVAGVVNQGGFVIPGSGALPGAFPGVYGVDPLYRPTGVVATFNNLGHWYGGGTAAGGGNYGHWYPGGITNGRGIAGYGGGGTGGGFVSAGGAVGGGFGGPRVGGMMGTALTGAATVNQLRR